MAIRVVKGITKCNGLGPCLPEGKLQPATVDEVAAVHVAC